MQALALELLWSRVRTSDWLFAWSSDAMLGWLQVAAVFIGVILVWVIYAGNAVRFRWTPGMDDLTLPFLVGIVEFVLIDTMGPETLGVWFVMQAVIFGGMAGVTQRILRRARLDGANDAYFRNFRPASLTDYLWPGVLVAAIALTGVTLGLSGARGPIAIIATAILTFLLIWQLYSQHHFYRRSMNSTEQSVGEGP